MYSVKVLLSFVVITPICIYNSYENIFITDIVDEDCKDISATCSQAPELCTRGFLSAQFRKWCKRTCGLCGESSDKPVLLTTVAPDKQVTAIISTTEYTPKYPLGLF